MTLLIHIEQRLGRVDIQSDVNDSNKVFEYLERLNELHKRFIQARKRVPPSTTVRRPQPSQNIRPITVGKIEAKMAERRGHDFSFRPIGTQPVVPQQLPSISLAPVEPQMFQRNDLPPQRLVQTTQPRVDITNNHENRANVDNFNATGDGARLSNVFQRTTDVPPMTPILVSPHDNPLGQFFNQLPGFVDISDVHEDDADVRNMGAGGIQNVANPSNNVDNRPQSPIIEQIQVDAQRDMNWGNTYDIQGAGNNIAPQAMNDENEDGIATQFEGLRAAIEYLAVIVNDQDEIIRRHRYELRQEQQYQFQEIRQLLTNVQQQQNVPTQTRSGAEQAQNPTLSVDAPIDSRTNIDIRDASRFGQFEYGRHPIRRDISAPVAPDTNVDPRSANIHRSSSQSNYVDTRRTYLPVHKWPIKFSGDPRDTRPERRDLVAFFKQIDMYVRSENVSYEEVFSRAVHLFEGKARIWYTQYSTRYRNWSGLQAGLKSHFETDLTKFERTQILHERKQYRNESCMDYVTQMSLMFDELDMHDEKEKIAIIRNGLREEFVLVAHAFSSRTVEELDQQLRRLELSTAIRRKNNHTQFKPAQKIFSTEVIEEDQLVTDEKTNVENETEIVSDCCAFSKFTKAKNWSKVEAPQGAEPKPYSGHQPNRDDRTKRSTNWTCFNCHSVGHGFMDCETPITRPFCFRCGKEGVVAPKCDCRSKNA